MFRNTYILGERASAYPEDLIARFELPYVSANGLYASRQVSTDSRIFGLTKTAREHTNENQYTLTRTSSSFGDGFFDLLELKNFRRPIFCKESLSFKERACSDQFFFSNTT